MEKRTYEVKHTGTDPQMEFWESPARFRAFVGGIGSGKTRAGCIEVLRQIHGSRGVVIAPTYPMLEDATLFTFEELFRPLISKMTRKPPNINLVNGTKIHFRSADNPDSLRGPNLGWFWLDEAALMPEMVWKVMVGRLRLEPGRGWVTTTPRGFNWLWEKFVNAKDPNYQMVQCSTDTNTFLPDHFFETLSTAYRGAFERQERKGEFVEWVDEPAYDFDRAKNVPLDGPGDLRQAVYNPNEPLCLCCDFNHRIMAWPIGQIVRGRPFIIGEAVKRGAGSRVEEPVREFRKQFPAHPGGVWIYGDATGKNRNAQTGQSDYDLVEAAFAEYPAPIEFMVQGRNPAPRDRINSVNVQLRGSADVMPIEIDASCEMLIKDLISCEWNPQGTDVLKVNNPDDNKNLLTHASDAVGYWIWMEWPVSEMTISAAAKRAAAEAQEQPPMFSGVTVDRYTGLPIVAQHGGLVDGL